MTRGPGNAVLPFMEGTRTIGSSLFFVTSLSLFRPNTKSLATTSTPVP